MKNIPKKFLAASHDRCARAVIRNCLESGASVRDMALQLTEKYRQSGPRVRAHLGRLLSIIYDFEASDIAEECARMFGLEVKEGLNVSQSVYISGYRDDETLYWRKNYTLEVMCRKEILEPYPAGDYPMTIPPRDLENVLTINGDDKLFAFMESDGTINFFVTENCPHDILVDEEKMFDEAPLYFTEHSHFISPVFKLKMVRTIFNYCLREIGFPNIRIKMTAFFTHPGVNLINIDEYEQGGASHAHWKGINVVMLKNVLPHYPLGNSIVFIDRDSEPLVNQLQSTIVYSVAATSILYEEICRRNLRTKLSPTTLASLCKSCGIFQ